MSVRVDCECGHGFEAADSQTGGIVNCPKCGHATQVAGLNDPFWTALKLGAGVVAVVSTVVVETQHGMGWGLIVAVGLAFLFWIVSLAL